MLKDFIDHLIGMNRTGTQVTVDGHNPILVEGTEVRGIENFSKKPYRVKAEQQFTSLAAFIAYINAFRQPTTAIIGSTDESSKTARFKAVMDYHGRPADAEADADGVVARKEATPEWCDHEAIYNAPLDPDFKAWMAIDGKEMDQKTLYDWFVDYQAQFIRPVAADVLAVIGHLKIVGELDASSNVQGGGLDTLIRETQKLKSVKAEDGVTFDLPDVWELALPVFKGMPQKYILPFRLLWAKDHRHGATFRLKLVRPHLLIEAAFNDAAAKIRETTGVEVFGEDASKVSKPDTASAPVADAAKE